MDEPIDLAAVQADDALIDALAAGLYVIVPSRDNERDYGPDDRLIAMLAAWKADVEGTPFPPLGDIPEPAASTAVVSTTAIRRSRRLVPLASIVASIVLALIGGLVGARDARPGDLLWGVTTVLYREHVQSVEAAAHVADKLATVRIALASGQTERAGQELAAVAPLLNAVAREDGGSQLVEQHQFLGAKLAETPVDTRTDPNAPLKGGQPAPAPTPSTGRGYSTSPTFTTAPGTPLSTPPSTSPAPSVDPRVLVAPVPATTTPAAPSTTMPPTPTVEGSPGPRTLPPTTAQPSPTATSPAATTIGTTTR